MRIVEYFVDAQDTARLHVAALIDTDIQNERILAFAEPFNAKYVPSLLSSLFLPSLPPFEIGFISCAEIKKRHPPYSSETVPRPK
jgi:hypothetical protein